MMQKYWDICSAECQYSFTRRPPTDHSGWEIFRKNSYVCYTFLSRNPAMQPVCMLVHTFVTIIPNYTYKYAFYTQTCNNNAASSLLFLCFYVYFEFYT